MSFFGFFSPLKRVSYEYQWFPNVTDLVAHLSFQDEAVGLIIVETIDCNFARTIGLIGHEFTLKNYILVDPFVGVAVQANNLDCDVQNYLSQLNVPETTGFTYCSISPVETVTSSVPPHEIESSVGESVEMAPPTSVTKKRVKRSAIIAPSRKKAAVDTSDKQ